MLQEGPRFRDRIIEVLCLRVHRGSLSPIIHPHWGRHLGGLIPRKRWSKILINWVQRLFDWPASQQSRSQQTLPDAKLPRPGGYALRLSIESDELRCARIALLLGRGGPVTVTLEVSKAVVYAIKGFTLWALSHITKKGQKVSAPLLADGNTASAVVVIPWGVWLRASSDHTDPGCIGRRVAKPMLDCGCGFPAAYLAAIAPQPTRQRECTRKKRSSAKGTRALFWDWVNSRPHFSHLFWAAFLASAVRPSLVMDFIRFLPPFRPRAAAAVFFRLAIGPLYAKRLAFSVPEKEN